MVINNKVLYDLVMPPQLLNLVLIHYITDRLIISSNLLRLFHLFQPQLQPKIYEIYQSSK